MSRCLKGGPPFWKQADPRAGGALAERIRSGGMRKKALEMGITTEEELQEMAEAWDEWIDQEDASFGCMHGEILVSR